MAYPFVFLLSFYLVLASRLDTKKPLYLLFPKDGKRFPTNQLTYYNKETKERKYKTETLYHFPCQTVIGDFRFITVDQKKFRYIDEAFLKNNNVKDCSWIKSYKGSGLNQYNQKSEFSPVYVIEAESSIGQYKITEVKPEIGEYN